MRNYIKKLEIVLPIGEILKIRGKLIKNNMGYSLLNLLIGSEDTLDSIENRYGIYIPIYGHVDDGNLHPHLMKLKKWREEDYEKISSEIYDITIQLGGVIAGEHGIGAVRRKYLSEKEVEILRDIKKIFDPNNILNSDKVVP